MVTSISLLIAVFFLTLWLVTYPSPLIFTVWDDGLSNPSRFNTSGVEFIGARCASINEQYYCYATVIKGRAKGVCASEAPFIPVKP